MKKEETKNKKTKISEGRTKSNQKIVTSDRPEAMPAKQKNKKEVKQDKIDEKTNFVQVEGGVNNSPVLGVTTFVNTSGITYVDGVSLSNYNNSSGNTTITKTPERHGIWPLDYITPEFTPKKQDLKSEIDYLSSIETKLIELNDKVSSLLYKVDDTIAGLTLRDLFLGKKPI